MAGAKGEGAKTCILSAGSAPPTDKPRFILLALLQYALTAAVMLAPVAALVWWLLWPRQ